MAGNEKREAGARDLLTLATAKALQQIMAAQLKHGTIDHAMLSEIYRRHDVVVQHFERRLAGALVHGE